MSTAHPSIDYEAVLADLEDKRTAIENAIAGVRQILGQAGASNLGHVSGSFTVTTEDAIPSDFFFKMSIFDAVKKYLGAAKGPRSTMQIVEALEKGGLTHASKDIRKTVSTILNQKAKEDVPEIVKIKKKWGLPAWYPGMRKNKKGGLDQVMDDLKDELSS